MEIDFTETDTSTIDIIEEPILTEDIALLLLLEEDIIMVEEQPLHQEDLQMYIEEVIEVLLLVHQEEQGLQEDTTLIEEALDLQDQQEVIIPTEVDL